MAEQDKQRSELLKKQLVQMGEDFEFMKKSKEEWKKQLDGRFQDIERYQVLDAGKLREVGSILPLRPREPTILSWPSSISSNSKSRRLVRICRTISMHYRKIRLTNSIKRTRKLPTSTRI